MPKPSKKIQTNDVSIEKAEQTLSIKYPKLIKQKLKEKNGFRWGYFTFFCVYDEEDRYHTTDDVVRENENQAAGWKQFLPEGYVAIASEDGWCLALSTSKDGRIYQFDNSSGEISVFAQTEEQLKEKLDQQEQEIETGL